MVADTDELKFDPQLATSATSMTVNSFYKNAVAEPPSLELRPPFQRNLVWNHRQKSYLVDSILRGLPVPELYIQTTTSAAGEERFVVVDGQQRISTCLEFINGDLVLDESDDLDPQWRGCSFEDLTDDLKKTFRSFQFIVRNLPDSASDRVLREIFRRLNRTVEVLEPQELRHAAYTGDFIQLVERAGSAAGLADLGLFSPKDYLRRRNDEFVAEVLVAIAGGAFPNKKDGLDDFFATFERQGFPDDMRLDLTRRFGRAVDFVGRKAQELKRTRFRNKSDGYSLLVYLALNAERLPADGAVTDELVAALVEFSDSVNRIKREEVEYEETDQQSHIEGEERDAEINARTYLRAVERAASDRLNRVRRDAALASLLGPVLAQTDPRPLTNNDEQWPLSGEESEAEVLDEDIEVEKRQVVEALMDAGR